MLRGRGSVWAGLEISKEDRGCEVGWNSGDEVRLGWFRVNLIISLGFASYCALLLYTFFFFLVLGHLLFWERSLVWVLLQRSFRLTKYG